MDAGLSTRASKTVTELLSKKAACAPPTNYDSKTAIDLSNAQNEVLRPELLEFFKSTIENDLKEEAFGLSALSGGDIELRQALSSFFNAYFSPIHSVTPEHIVLTAGASDAIENLIHTICDDGDSVIIPGPYWYGFEPILKARANVNIILAQPPTYKNYDNYLLPSIQAAYDFASAETKARIKAVVMTNPHNPLSRCYSKRAIVECMEFCQERGLHLISDEIYGLVSLNTRKEGDNDFVSALSLTEPLVPEGAVKVDPSRVHIIWSASKLFGSSGLRVGCLISQQNPQLIGAVSLLTPSHTNNIACLYLSSLLRWSQLPTLLALNTERLSESYRIIAEALCSWGIEFITPTNGTFVFAKLCKKARTPQDEVAFFNKLAVQGVRVGPGHLYKGVEGDYGWCRIRFSVRPEVIKKVKSVIGQFLTQET